MKPKVSLLAEPLLEFGAGQATTPKEGLVASGPYSLRLGKTHKSEIRVGLVGPPGAIAAAARFLDRCTGFIPSAMTNPALFPDFPGFEDVFRSRLVRDARWDSEISDERLNAALQKSPSAAFVESLSLWLQAINLVAGERDSRPDLILCCIPQELLSKCARIENKRLSGGEHRWLRKQERLRAQGQFSLFDGEQELIEDAADPNPEDLLFRNFRSALKASAMPLGIPLQLVTPHLWDDDQRNQDPATRAWNLSVACFYKAGGIPWRIAAAHEATCWVGISFHHLRSARRHIVYSSLAQAFSTDGEGFALRGGAAPTTKDDRTPHLTDEQTVELMEKVLNAYRDRTGRDPQRVVVHKTSKFFPEERDGAQQALASVPSIELITLRSGEFRMVRQGKYPPHRGTVCQLEPTTFLFTTGYMPEHMTYPGPHIPVPLEIANGAGAIDYERAAEEVLALTKMNWNSAASFMSLPVTLGVARRVGGILTEVPRQRVVPPSFRFYM